MSQRNKKNSTTLSPLCQSFSLPNELLLAESQWLFTEAELSSTPSVLDGLTPEKERENRGKGVNFILQAGIMLKLPQITLATASVYLHRFFMRYSMVDLPHRAGLHYYSIAATSLFLATKVEEDCQKMKELVVACVRVAQKDPSKVVDEQDKEYWRWKDTILHNEDLLLEALCFDLSLEPPYKTLFELLIRFREVNNKRLRNAAWAFVNDSCLTMLCLLFSSRIIAASALYAAAKHCGVSFPDDAQGRAWWEIVGVDLRSVRRACNFMAEVYENSPLRGGGEAGIYERTPEDGVEWAAKTRAVGGERDRSTATLEDEILVNGNSAISPGRNGELRGKRERAETENERLYINSNGQVSSNNNGNGYGSGNAESPLEESVEDMDYKRRKMNSSSREDPRFEPRSLGEPISQCKSPTKLGPLESPVMDDVSEEGEVEP
ncbi:hypothetical protein MMC12_006531 [Toensbergia leucococca]|nr:hypothetical protein [Toensbergia leucococca]